MLGKRSILADVDVNVGVTKQTKNELCKISNLIVEGCVLHEAKNTNYVTSVVSYN